MVNGVVCHAHHVDSHTAATMWQESVTVFQDIQEPIVIKVGIIKFHIMKIMWDFWCIDLPAITSSNNILQIVLLDIMANYVLKCVIIVLTILHATPTMGIVNVCLVGLQVTAQSVS